MAKSRRKRDRNRGSRGNAPGRAPRQRLTAEEREVELAVAEMKRRAQEALSPDTPPERVATLLVEDFEDLPSPVGFVQTLTESGPSERAHAVAAEAHRLAPGSVTALTLAAELARTVDDDPERASTLLDEALDADLDPDGVAELAQHLLEAERPLDAVGLLEPYLIDEPEDEDAQEVRAWALQRIHRCLQAGETLAQAEEQALGRFSDRGLLYRLREALGEFIEQRPELQELIAFTAREWLQELREAEADELEVEQPGGDRLEERYDGILRLAIEHAWLVEKDADDDDEDEIEFEPAPALDDSGAPLALFATDPDTSPELARAARGWLASCTFGLWQVSDPDPAPGVWLTDLVSGVRRYAAIPAEQLEGASRWSVLMGALVALDGTWRSTSALVIMRPAEADWAAEFAREATMDVASALIGKRVRRRTGRRNVPEPHGVLAEQTGPAPPEVADLASKVLGNLIPGIAGELWHRRDAGPKLANTDGHRLRFITARVTVNDTAAAVQRLAAHPDFKSEEDGELSWWGRELSEMERQSALAQLRSQLAEQEVEDPQETPRWLRGRLQPREHGFEIEVNSEERLAMLLELLAQLGHQPEVTRRSVIDPTQDMPPIQTGGPIPFAASQEAIEAWLSQWPNERVPALDQLTPRTAAKRSKQRPRLEALLREFEHDAHLLTQHGKPAPDIRRLRTELNMQR